MKKKKIFLNGRFLTQPITGVQRTAYEMILALDGILKENPQLLSRYAYCVVYSGKMINPIQLEHIKLIKRGILKGNLWEQLELPIYTFGHLLVSLCTISCLVKRRQLVMVHDVSFKVNPQFFSLGFRLWYQFAIPILARMAKHVITVSGFSKQQLIEHLDLKADHVTVIYNAADHIKRFGSPHPDFISKIAKLRPFILAVSSVSANKNFKVIGEAIDSGKFEGYHFLIAGGRAKTLQHDIPHENVIYLGYVSDAELVYLYHTAALFIFPSFYEGFGIPPIEAMYASCAVIAANGSAIPEILDNACVYFDPNNAAELTAKIRELINDPRKLLLYKEMGHRRAISFNWEDSARQLQQLIETYSV